LNSSTKQIKETFDVIEKYRDPCAMIPEKILDVHVAVTLVIGYNRYMIREINETIDHLTTWPNLMENFITALVQRLSASMRACQPSTALTASRWPLQVKLGMVMTKPGGQCLWFCLVQVLMGPFS
jgi:hypothetical protein